ncbi:MAG: ABC transporter ATP-binding protein, partial [Acidobacteria bacterium]|nr:ABC transporter ATP-binding protein [Acidobacteriota bacterium]
VPAVRGVSFDIAPGETLALVGESGCGKSTIARTLLGLLDGRECLISGRILFGGRDLTGLPSSEWRSLRGREMAILFQDPRGALNPVLTVGAHLLETMRAHRRISRREAQAEAKRLLGEVGIPDPGYHLGRYPSELSTGLCQRVGLALAICLHPRLLVADEPTSALDTGIQQQVMELIREMKRRYAQSMLLISHDLGLVAGLADRIAVSYHGKIVECAETRAITRSPAHPYTRALLDCRPGMERRHDHSPLSVIPGTPPGPETEMPGCSFTPRCPLSDSRCAGSLPPMTHLSETHHAACFKPLGGAS